MPVIKSAKKKLRQDKKRTFQNKHIKEKLREALKKAQKSRTKEDITLASKLADKAAKRRIIHHNKAARLKSKLSKLLKNKKQKASLAKPRK